MSFIAEDQIDLAIFKKQHKVVIASLTVPTSDSSFLPLPWKSEPPSFRSPYFSANSLNPVKRNYVGQTQCRRLPHEWGLGKGKTEASLPPANLRRGCF